MFKKCNNSFYKILCVLSISLVFYACDYDEDGDPGILSPEETKDTSKDSPVPVITNVDKNTTDASQVLALVNKARTERGLNKLVLNDVLNKTAYKHSLDMNNQGYFDHTGKDGSKFYERTKREGYKGSARGENIARGQRTAKEVHNDWMKSDGHKANILAEGITEMGLGRHNNTWTQIFGKN